MLGLQPGTLSSAAMLCVCSLGSLLMIRIRIHYTSKGVKCYTTPPVVMILADLALEL